MTATNKIITNPKTGHEIEFLQTGTGTKGELLEMISTYHFCSEEPPAHYHPFQEENFTVIEGQLTVRMDNGLTVLNPGDKLHIPRGKIHAMWNDTYVKTVVNWKVQPAMDTMNFLETTFGLARDGKTNAKGMPDIFQIALIAKKYSSVFRLAKPPFFIQKIIFIILMPISYLMGYKATYPKYFN